MNRPDAGTINSASVLARLYRIEEVIVKVFAERVGREPVASDKVTKIIEELGEFLQAHKKLGPDQIMEEVWDAVIAVITLGFSVGFTPLAMEDGLEKAIRKLETRWLRGAPDPDRIEKWAQK